MISSLKQLLYIELVAQLALCACTLLFAMSIVVFTSISPGSGSNTVLVLPLALAAYLTTAVPVALLVAPIYAVLEAKRRVTTISALMIGAIPGLAMLIYAETLSPSRGVDSPALPVIILIFGIFVATTLHLFRSWTIQNDHAV